MPKTLSFHEFQELAQSAKRVAIYQEILADRVTPITIAENLAEELQEGAILESGLQSPESGRYSFIAFGIVAQLRVENYQVFEHHKDEIIAHSLPAFTVLNKMVKKFFCAGHQPLKNIISGGAIGFVSYDAIRLFERIPDQHLSTSIPQMLFNFYHTHLIFDHAKQTLRISMDVEINGDLQQLYQQTQQAINQLIAKIHSSIPQTLKNTLSTAPLLELSEVDIPDEKFIKLILQAQAHIQAGDAFQIVLSRCFKRKFQAKPLTIYRALRKVSPSPYMFYLPSNDFVILGASPETFISAYNQQVTINPIAGTRKNTGNIDHEAIAQELMHDQKECAEHMMLVDVARNDLGKVCQPGSIKVSELMNIKHCSHVTHLSSTVTGQLEKGRNAFDAFVSAFPAATLSGAPKIRAMHIIDQLETSKRGLYGGAICRLDYQGNLDSCIAIRMAVLKDGIATVRTGAGIVMDSIPQAEADETRHKAAAILEAIKIAEEELV